MAIVSGTRDRGTVRRLPDFASQEPDDDRG